MSKLIKELADRQAKLDEKIDAVRQAKTNTNPNTPSTEEVFGSPYARKGENVLSSRGFQFQRMIGVMTGLIEPEFAKVELDVADRLRKSMLVDNKFATVKGTKFLAPLGTDLMGGEAIDENFRHEMKQMTYAGVCNIDPGEMDWVRRKTYGMKTAQSWVNENLGGALVAPPEFGELIQLLRNKDALVNAGARVIPLPPSGRIQFPRQTSPTTGYWVGENTQITSSNFNTGKLTLSAKKVAALVTLPNELIRFASPATEAILRADMTKTLSLTMDYALLYGEGSDNIPMGLLNVPNIGVVTPTTVASGGNTLSPQDLYSFISTVEANNAEFQGWIMRPELFYDFVGARSSVYNGSTTSQYGQYVYDQFRPLGAGFPKVLAGYPCVTTPQVSITQSKGGSNNLTTVFGGQWDDYIIAMFGTIEFAEATQGDTAFADDQTVVRAILTCDGAPRHAGAFAVADQLVVAVGS
jgi:HK97 family phage major capsid protein